MKKLAVVFLTVCMLASAASNAYAESGGDLMSYGDAIGYLNGISLTDAEGLRLVRDSLAAVGYRYYAPQYRLVTEALLVFSQGEEGRFAEVEAGLEMLTYNQGFIADYLQYDSLAFLPFEALLQYAAARRLEAEGKAPEAYEMYAQAQVLDSLERGVALMMNSGSPDREAGGDTKEALPAFDMREAGKLQHVVDNAGLFSGTETEALESALRDVYDRYGFDSVILTGADLQEKPAHLYAAEFYDAFRDVDRYPDGVIFYLNVNPAVREYNEAARGKGMTLLSDRGSDELEGVVVPFLRSDDYAGAMFSYVAYLRKLLSGAGPAVEKTKVTIWHTFTEAQEAYLLKAAADFTASREEVAVEVLSQPYAGFTETVNSAVVAGTGPDIIFNYASEAANYVDAGLVADLSQYIYDDETGIEGFDGSLAQGVMDGEVNGFSDGLIHYLPAYTTGPILFYNKTLFDELAITVPTTWEEMEAACAKIWEAKGIAGLGFDSLTDLLQMFIMEAPGSGYIDTENKAVLFDTPEVRAKLQWLVDMTKKGYFKIKSSGNYFSDDFNSGSVVASYIGSCAGYPYIKPNGFEFGMAPVPATTWYPSWNRGPIVFYYKDDARAQGAYLFVKYFISADVNAGWAEAVNALAPYSWTKETEAYKAYVARDTLGVQALKGVEANLGIAGSLPAVTGAAVVRNAIRDAVIKAAGGEMTAEEAWTECVKLSNSALKGE